MVDFIGRTLDKLRDTNIILKDIGPRRRVSRFADENDLERDLRQRLEKRNFIAAKRDEANRVRNERGLPVRHPSPPKKEDYQQQCDKAENLILSDQLASEDNRHASSLSASRNSGASVMDKSINYRNMSYIPPECSGELIPLDQPFVSERSTRAKLRGASLYTDVCSQEKQPISNVFPQTIVQEELRGSEEEKAAKEYLYSSTYMSSYSHPHHSGNLRCRRIFPVRVLENLPDPIRSVHTANSHYAPSCSWMPEGFDPKEFDRREMHFPYCKDPRPHEFCSPYPRIAQIPTYSGSFAMQDQRGSVDNPYDEYKPRNLVRGETPSRPIIELSRHIRTFGPCPEESITEQQIPKSDLKQCGINIQA